MFGVKSLSQCNFAFSLQKHRVAVMLNERKRQKRPEIQAPPDDLIKHAKDLA